MIDKLWLCAGFNAALLGAIALDPGVFHRKSPVGRSEAVGRPFTAEDSEEIRG